MLDAAELARRIVDAMDSAQPRVTSSALAAECDVTPQSVHGWRTTGRISKRYLPVLARLTGRQLEYFVGAEPRRSSSASENLDPEEVSALRQLQQALPDWRRYVLGLAKIPRQQQEMMLRTIRQASAEYVVERKPLVSIDERTTRSATKARRRTTR
jgi:hypothetical protein